jgi:signal transduction histidine kinase
MTFRTKLFILPALAVGAAAGLVAWGTEQYARRQFEHSDRERSETLVAQFRRELAQHGEEVARAVQGIAGAEATLRMALELSQPQADPSLYSNDARGLANIYHLDFLELAGGDGTLISSAHWPARSGYRNDWVVQETNWERQGAFLAQVQLPDTVEAGLLAVQVVRVGERNLYVIGGQRLDREFLQTLALPAGMRVLLYLNLEPAFVPAALSGAEGPVADAEPFAGLVESVRRGENPGPQTIEISTDPASAETFIAAPLAGRGNELLGVLLVGSAQRDLMALVSYIRALGLAGAGAGVVLAMLLSWWGAARVSRPLARLTALAREVEAGNLAARVERPSRGEAGRLAGAFNDMLRRLADDRERLVQSERAAARREMARRITHEVKEPLFPMQIAAEDLVQARQQTSERFDEVFFESTTILRAELEQLKEIAARFSEFAKMPPPRRAPVSVNDAVRAALKSLEPHFGAVGRPPVSPEVYLGEPTAVIEADPDLLRKALDGLLLYIFEAMPAGGTLTVRTRQQDAVAHIEISAAGAVLRPEECARLFTLNGTSGNRPSGLGLVTAHAVVSDHGGRISAESAPGAGTTFRLDFPVAPAGVTPAPTLMNQVAPEANAEEAERPEAETVTRPAADAGA